MPNSAVDASLALCQELIRRESITPNDNGCQAILASRLDKIGFKIETIEIKGVTNLWATKGETGPTLCFAGHTDVVPTGELSQWTHPPFEAHIENDWLYGRGTADMKGALAAMITACEAFIKKHPNHRNRIAFLITSDEEGPATYGTKAVLDVLKKREDIPKWCLIGEPSSESTLGDTIKVGRRGSITGFAECIGKQGHVAYPHLATNPIHQAVLALQNLLTIDWGKSHPLFPTTTFQIANIQSGTGATNVIPNNLLANFNIRFAPPLQAEQIKQTIEDKLKILNLQFEINWKLSGNPFYTELNSPLVEAVTKATKDITGTPPKACTGGGTSDGRFFALYGCDVVELGLVNQTIHQIDERIQYKDLKKLSHMYFNVLENLLS
jgi:succinyl-diaminopimelate desuccinylase